MGSLKALIIPGAANAFGIFWLRQYSQNSIHDELVEAATLDGLWVPRGLPARRVAVGAAALAFLVIARQVIKGATEGAIRG